MKSALRNVLVTGAAKRGGRAIALRLGKLGFNVAVHYHRSGKEAQQTVERLSRLGVKASRFQADLSSLAEIEKLIRSLKENFGPIDILVNNAAIFSRTPFRRVTERDWDQFLKTNLKGPFFLTRALGIPMKQRKRGLIINIADWAGLHPYKNYLPYSISKGGLIPLTQGLAKILSPHVKVYALAPRRLHGFQGIAEVVAKFIYQKRFRSGSTYEIDGRLLVR